MGGGDGGVLREVAKHPTVDEIHICEIDEVIKIKEYHVKLMSFLVIVSQRVIEIAKEYLPEMSVGYDNPKVRVHVHDGSEFLLHNTEKFDVIITDSTDPIGEYILHPYQKNKNFF